MFKNRNLVIVSLIALINALGYGIIIPILYTYSTKFGLTDAQNGLLFALFSACQFISTPIIGRLSDKYGRKPLLAISVAGTALSFFMAAFAPNAIILFLARALDGLTAGNIPVVSSVISDSTKPEDRAKGFGIIGASFGFGFVFGPAISALTSPYGLQIPFIISGVIGVIATLATVLFLPETNKHIGQVSNEKLFDLRKLALMLFDKSVGVTLLISLLFSTTFGLFIFAFQAFSVKGLQLSPNNIASIYTLFGVLGIIAQTLLIPRTVKLLGDRRAMIMSLTLTSVSYGLLFLSFNIVSFILACVVLSLSSSFLNPLVQTLLSKETDAKSQGSIQGINASYVSIGTIIGPVVGGLLATYSLRIPFILGSVICLVCVILAYRLLHTRIVKESAF